MRCRRCGMGGRWRPGTGRLWLSGVQSGAGPGRGWCAARSWWPRRLSSGATGGLGRLEVCSLDGTLIRVPDTPANRAAFGSVGTSDDSAPFPQLRALPLNNVSTRALLGMTHGPSGGGAGKAAGEQKLLDEAMEAYP